MKTLAVVATGFAVACAGAKVTHPTPTATGDVVIPTRYVNDRFFATPVLERGDTATLFLDTGSSTFVIENFIPFLELTPTDSIMSRGAKVAVMSFPKFRADASVPAAVAPSVQGRGLIAYPNDWRASNNFVAWISREAQGQLGNNWFNGRAWTFDYPRHRLTLHRSGAPASTRGRALPMHFAVDTAGQRVGHNAWVDVVIDGDTLAMQWDTGATIWLSRAALDRVADGGPSERSSTHLPSWEFERLRKRHPDWPVIEKADLWIGWSVIQVQHVSVAGYEVGPTWMSIIPGATAPPTGNPAMPWTKRQGGTIGGSLLKHFVVTVDYPAGTMRFDRP